MAFTGIGLAALGFNAVRSNTPIPPVPPTPMAMVAASTFLATVENNDQPAGKAPDGMLWIPGGEFSMGAADPNGTDRNDVGMHATDDSRPVHRTYVDGF